MQIEIIFLPEYPAKLGSMYCKEPFSTIIFAPPTNKLSYET